MPSAWVDAAPRHSHAAVHAAVQVGGRYLSKRIHVRVEHVQPSRCREDFLKRRVENDAVKHEAKAKGLPVPKTKRAIKGTREALTVIPAKLETITAIPYDIIKEVRARRGRAACARVGGWQLRARRHKGGRAACMAAGCGGEGGQPQRA